MSETALKIAREKERERVLQVLDHYGSPALGEDHGDADCSTVGQLSKEQPMADSMQEQVVAHLKKTAACGDPPQDQAPGENRGLWGQPHTQTGLLVGMMNL